MGLRIVQISKDWSENGGVVTYVRHLSAALAGAGHEVLVVHADPGAPGPPPGVQSRFVDDFASHTPPLDAASAVMDVLASYDPHVVHVQGNNNFALEFRLRGRYPTVKTLHVFDFCPTDTKFHHTTRRPCEHPTSALCLPRMVVKRCLLDKRPSVIWQRYRRVVEANRNNHSYRTIVVASEYVRRQALATGYDPRSVVVVPYFTRAPGDPTPVPAESRTVLFSGRIVREKGLHLLLRALARLTGVWRLVVAGDGMERERVSRLAVRLGIADRVEFRGWLTGRALAAAYDEAAVVAVPSLWPEPFGLAGLEALACARPVVGFAVGGIPEWLDEGVSGFLVRPYDVGAMAERIGRLLEDGTLATRLGVQGRARVQRDFVAAPHLERLMHLYARVREGMGR